ncbi:carbohydrate ABC transporter permease [Streptomyces sp. A5-4]|uniref:carbohydrate ABC transporter permease n=1 Tax=Streptomyces sp. A5-4 TaxID=3384771 RepID=UPI003DA95E6E
MRPFTPQAASPAGTGDAVPDRTSKEPPSQEPPKEPLESARGKAWRRRRYRWDIKYSPYALVAPFFVFFAAFGVFPLLYTGWTSLHRVSLTSPNDMEWVGLGNFTRLIEDEFFWNALRNTFTIGIISTVPQLLMALAIAHLLNYRLRASGFFRVAILTPYATSVAAATLVFVLLFGRDYGMINWLLESVGFGKIDWQSGTLSSQIAVSSIVIWRWTGYNALIYLAAMQAVPNDLYESAALDGATRWQQFLHVTIPSLRPTILFTVVVSTIGATQLFGEPLLFGGAGGQKGGASHQFQTLGLYLYEQGWFNFHLGRASAIAWTMFLLLLIIAAVNLLIVRRLRKTQ